MHYLNLRIDFKIYLIFMTNYREFDLTLHLLTDFSIVTYKTFVFFGTVQRGI